MAYEFKKYQDTDGWKEWQEEEQKKNEYANKVENFGDYTQNEATTNAQNLWNKYQNAVENYGDFAYGRQDAYDSLLDQILNRKDFSYDLNGDALYQQYKDRFKRDGKMAMMDTVGQASAMTGGYGNSYATTAGSQAYQSQLQNLNDIVPELYSLAYDKYAQEGQDLANKFGIVSSDRNQQYSEWGDALSRLIDQRGYYGDTYFNLDSQGRADYEDRYNKVLDMLNHYTDSAKDVYDRTYGEFTDLETNNYKAYTDNQTNARNDVYAAVQSGVMPSDELITAAGLDKATVLALQQTYKTQLDAELDSKKASTKYTQSQTIGSVGDVGDVGDAGGNSPSESPKTPTYVAPTQKIALEGLAASMKGNAAWEEFCNKYAEYDLEAINSFIDEAEWSLKSNGGANGFLGLGKVFGNIDDNGSVNTPYGELKMKALYNELVAQGVPKESAKSYVVGLQNRYGI